MNLAIRPYEISVWTLQDSFISVLKDSRLENRVFLEAPEINIKNDGTQELTFSVPMYYRENGELVENPLWWDIKDGLLTINLRKLKVIFHKGEKDKEEIFEFVVDKISETHTGGKLQQEVIATGLAFQELGKRGYKISLNQFTFEEVYDKWFKAEVGEDKEYKTQEDKNAAEPIPNLNFWADRIFENTNWNYSIQMDWSYIDGIIGARNEDVRRPNKVYEEEYITSWEEQSGQLIPTGMENFKEKARIVEIDKSNIYNASQTLAETFGIYCKYKYHYDTNHHIIERECIFYNNFLAEKDKIDINYPYDAKSIKREIDSADVITKLYVPSVENEFSPSGLVTIADASANKTGEDYILNFDYLYSIGTISQDQYDEIKEYEKDMFLINSQLRPLEQAIAKLETDLIKYKAEETLAVNAQGLAKEQMEQSLALLESLSSGTGVLEKTISKPYRAILTPSEVNSESEQLYYIKISQEGVLLEHTIEEEGEERTISLKIWYRSTTSTESEPYSPYNGGYEVDIDGNGNIVGLDKIKLMEDSINSVYYLTFCYRPSLYYENVYKTFLNILQQNETKEKNAKENKEKIELEIKEKQKQYQELLEKKKKDIASFENLMGPAIREGSWQAEDLKDYGTKRNVILSNGESSSDELSFIWDTQPFDGEQLAIYDIITENGGIETKNYYCIELKEEVVKKLVGENKIDKLSFLYKVEPEQNIYQQMNIGAELQYVYIKDVSLEYKPAVLLTDLSFDIVRDGEDCKLGIISTSFIEGNTNIEIEYLDESPSFIEEYEIIYPRFKIDSLLLKTSDDELIISEKVGDEITKLKNFYDYSILIRDGAYYITLDNKILLKDISSFEISYTLSNASLHLYLDALEVSKINAFPKTSYEVEISAVNKDFIEKAYNYLNRVISINDRELKFNDVQGYISEISLKLNTPWEDSFVVQNYKTKFEDLFSSIVASTEAMKSNSYIYGMAANAFMPNGTLKPSILQNAISDINLTYAFQNGNLTIDEVNGIWATSDDGVVAIRGGGIFCATKKDSYGNWVWNTGILPSGINASLITAGQLDTNLIKVYAGDNLRFQLNGDGLFAYGKTETGETDFSSYVVHNEDGLFLTQDNVNKVEVSWNGFILRNNEGNKVFYADEQGNLTISGQIAATTGSIGGWEIQSDGLRSKNNNAGLISTPSSDQDTVPGEVFWVNGLGTNNTFKVTEDGTMYANNVIVKGFISGATSSDELDNQLRAISFTILQGTTFIFDNRNYDGNLVINPEHLYFRINTNALTDEELTESEYIFFYGLLSEDGQINWNKLENNGSPISFDPNYLTLIVKSDIMYLGLDDASQPNSVIYLKVEKTGKTREKIDSGEFKYTEHTYSAEIQLVSQLNGIGKIVSEIDPQSYSFIEDKNAGLSYEKTATFSTVLKGFTLDEAARGMWLINGVDWNLTLGKDEDTEDGSGDSYIIFEGDPELLADIIELNGGAAASYDDNKLILDSSQEGNFQVFLKEQEDGSILASAIVPELLVPEGGNIKLSYKIDNAVRNAYCFKVRNGSDGVSIVMRSSSGETLVSGDTETLLSIDIYYSSQLVNIESSRNSFYYVWKKDGKVLNQIRDTNKNILSFGNTNFFLQREILIYASDFGLKSNYDCYVFTSEEEAEAYYNNSI